VGENDPINAMKGNTEMEYDIENIKRADYQERLFARADELLDAELAKGAPFTEGLCNWATRQAEREVSP